MLFEGLVKNKIKIESRQHCIDIYDTDCSLFIIHRHWTYMVVNTSICCGKRKKKLNLMYNLQFCLMVILKIFREQLWMY